MAEQGHKWFAAIYDRLMASAEKSFMKRIRQEVVGGARGRVLEIGCGTGASFPYYDSGVEQVIATEPDPYMLARARKRAAALSLPLELHQAPAEELPFPDHSFDTVVSTLVMCTVGDLEKALHEVKRVLKPYGHFRFYEHVRAEHPLGALMQDLITPVWGWLGAGCHPNRDVGRAIAQAGFRLLELQRLHPVPPIPPMCISRPHIKGIARPE